MKNRLESTQSILSLGYILLIVLGIIHETLFYSQLGINILEYSDLLDVLISPISKLSSNIVLLTLSLLVVLALILIPKRSQALKNKKWFMRFFKLNKATINIERRVFETLAILSVLFFVGIFVGTGSGKGRKLKNKIQSEEIAYNDQINFTDGQLLPVKIIGKNSSYVFYLTPKESDVKISPINGTIKHLTIKSAKFKAINIP